VRPSVIFSTYNSPDWLEKVIWGFSAQSYQGFEILIADDGSTAVTKQRIDSLRLMTQLDIKHVWHEDRGFRKCEILNRAIEQSTGDYLIFTDGDCIPRADFVATHVANAKTGYFLSGGMFRLPMKTSLEISRVDIQRGLFARPKWLRQHGVSWSPKMLKLAFGGALAKFADILTPTRATWNGHNASAWKSDILAVNGYDQRMTYGGLDREMGERLVNAGIKPVQLRHRAVCVHLDHPRGYATADSWKRNREIWDTTIKTKSKRTSYGIVVDSEQMLKKAA
jgi:glycosyltransferase involved in cell wall biosynthesis